MASHSTANFHVIETSAVFIPNRRRRAKAAFRTGSQSHILDIFEDRFPAVRQIPCQHLTARSRYLLQGLCLFDQGHFLAFTEVPANTFTDGFVSKQGAINVTCNQSGKGVHDSKCPAHSTVSVTAFNYLSPD